MAVDDGRTYMIVVFDGGTRGDTRERYLWVVPDDRTR